MTVWMAPRELPFQKVFPCIIDTTEYESIEELGTKLVVVG